MKVEEIFDQVMDVVFNTAKGLLSLASAWVVGPVGGGRLIRESEFSRNLRMSRPPALNLYAHANPSYFREARVIDGPWSGQRDPRDNFTLMPITWERWLTRPWLNDDEYYQFQHSIIGNDGTRRDL